MTDYSQPKYPIYIISKGRADSRLTSKTLDELNVPYRIVIDESEYDRYDENITAEKKLTVTRGLQEKPLYNTREKDGRTGGASPTRNCGRENDSVDSQASKGAKEENRRN